VWGNEVKEVNSARVPKRRLQLPEVFGMLKIANPSELVGCHPDVVCEFLPSGCFFKPFDEISLSKPKKKLKKMSR
jgi:hypothetical protein